MKKRQIVIINKRDINKKKVFDSILDCARWFIIQHNYDNDKLENVRRYIQKVLSDKYLSANSYSGFYILYKEDEKSFFKKKVIQLYKEELAKLDKNETLDIEFIIKIIRRLFPSRKHLYRKPSLIKEILKRYHYSILNNLIENKVIKIIRLPLNLMHIYIGDVIKGTARCKVLLFKFPKREKDTPYKRNLRLYFKTFFTKKMAKKCL